MVEAYYCLDSVVTTVDAVHGESQLDAQPESVKQAAVADRIVVTKTDLAAPGAVDRLAARLKRLNPAAPLITVVQGNADPGELFNAGLYNPDTKSIDVRAWLRAEAYAEAGHGHDDHGHDHDDHHGHDHGHGHDHKDQSPLDVNRHDARIRAHCLVLDEPLDWESFSLWLGSLASGYGDKLLRVKAILNVKDEPTPVAVHGVQHMFHPPARLPAWPDADRRSKLVFITRDLERSFLEESLAAYRSSATPAS